jgi:hypothetical protein
MPLDAGTDDLAIHAFCQNLLGAATGSGIPGWTNWLHSLSGSRRALSHSGSGRSVNPIPATRIRKIPAEGAR